MPTKILNAAIASAVVYSRGDATSPTLKGLAAGAALLSAEINPTTDRNREADLFLKVKFGTSPAAGAAVYVWFLKSQDAGTTFATGDATTLPGRPADFVFYPQLNTNQQLLDLPNRIELPQGKFKALVQNVASQNFSSAANDECQLLAVEGTPEIQ